jgi:hypothetical protein
MINTIGLKQLIEAALAVNAQLEGAYEQFQKAREAQGLPRFSELSTRQPVPWPE